MSKSDFACNVIGVRLSSAHCLTKISVTIAKFKCNHVHKAAVDEEWRSAFLLSRMIFRCKKNYFSFQNI